MPAQCHCAGLHPLHYPAARSYRRAWWGFGHGKPCPYATRPGRNSAAGKSTLRANLLNEYRAFPKRAARCKLSSAKRSIIEALVISQSVRACWAN